jgi:hypothetical protein
MSIKKEKKTITPKQISWTVNFQILSPWNSRLKFSQKAYFSINVILKNEIKKKIQSKKFIKVKQIAIKKIRTKSDIKIKWNKMLRDEIKK